MKKSCMLNVFQLIWIAHLILTVKSRRPDLLPPPENRSLFWQYSITVQKESGRIPLGWPNLDVAASVDFSLVEDELYLEESAEGY